MRRWLWVMCVVACSRRIEHFHDDAAPPLPDGTPAVIDAVVDPVVDASASVCPQTSATTGVGCANAGFAAQPGILTSGELWPAAIGDLDGDGLNDFIGQIPGSFIVYFQRNGT